MIVDFDTQSFINHATGTANGLVCRIERNGGTTHVRTWNTNAGDPTGGRNRPLHIRYAGAETTPGTVTYSAVCFRQGAAPAQVSDYSLTAIYSEHRY